MLVSGLLFLRVLQVKKRADERTRTADLISLRVIGRALQGVANPAYLKGFLCTGLPRVAPYCAPGGVRVVSKATAARPATVTHDPSPSRGLRTAVGPGRPHYRFSSCTAQPLPSGSSKKRYREPGEPSGPSCCTSPTGTPRPASSSRTASTSSTTSCTPLTDPGSPSGRPSPTTTEQADPGGVICTTRMPPPGRTSWSR